MTGLFRIFVPASLLGLVVSDAILIVACYTGPIFILMDIDTVQIYFQYEGGGARVAIAAGIPLIGLYLGDVYDRAGMRLSLQFTQYFSLVIGVGFLIQALLLSFEGDLEMPRQSMLVGSLLALILLPAWRWVYQNASPHALEPEKLLFAGTHPLQLRLAAHIAEHGELSLKPLGFLVEKENEPQMVFPVLGTLHGWEKALEGQTVDQVIVGLDVAQAPAVAEHALALQHGGLRTTRMTDSYELLFGKVPVPDIPPAELVFGSTYWPSPFAVAVQLHASRLFALALGLLLLPVAVLTVLLLWITTRGPIIVSRRVLGKNERPFSLRSFRTRGRLGAVLRRTGLERIPTIWNLIRGDLVLVGPRPTRVECAALIVERIPLFRHRTFIRPGITGWAHVQGGDEILDVLSEIEYDLYYMKNFSLQMDAIILLRAFKRKLRTGG
ncbi:MAG: sugar transferase [Bryobacteraceae bacterium]|nr:sugar transferase [Bryobacteraceae bacterium]